MFGGTEKDPLEPQKRLGHAPAGIDLTNQVFLGDVHVVEKHLTQLIMQVEVEHGTHRDTRTIHRD
ncbi:hypothetical protein D3C73_1259220 [compost metagenome]